MDHDGEPLGLLPGRWLIIACAPCRRRGRYRLDRLRHRFGDSARLYDVYVALTQTCRFQHAAGMRVPNQYGRGCRAHVATEDVEAVDSSPSRA